MPWDRFLHVLLCKGGTDLEYMPQAYSPTYLQEGGAGPDMLLWSGEVEGEDCPRPSQGALLLPYAHLPTHHLHHGVCELEGRNHLLYAYAYLSPTTLHSPHLYYTRALPATIMPGGGCGGEWRQGGEATTGPLPTHTPTCSSPIHTCSHTFLQQTGWTGGDLTF